MIPVRPLPRQGVYEVPFWEFVRSRELRLQRCSECLKFWYPPGPSCPHCLSVSWEWVPVSGRAKALSWTTFHRQYFDSIPVPYTVIAATLEEGPILIADAPDAPFDTVRPGTALEIAYSDVVSPEGTDFTLYHWTVS